MSQETFSPWGPWYIRCDLVLWLKWINFIIFQFGDSVSLTVFLVGYLWVKMYFNKFNYFQRDYFKAYPELFFAMNLLLNTSPSICRKMSSITYTTSTLLELLKKGQANSRNRVSPKVLKHNFTYVVKASRPLIFDLSKSTWNAVASIGNRWALPLFLDKW